MKKDNLTFQEIQAAEQASEERKQSRNQGFAKMYERDQVMKHLYKSSYMNKKDITMLWPVDPKQVKTPAGGVWPHIPEDTFLLVIDGKEYRFDTNEFRRWLRWA